MLAHNSTGDVLSRFGMRVSLDQSTFERGNKIYSENEPAEYVYQIKDGAARTYKLLPDGRRHIGAFHLPGDIFGLEIHGEHRYTAEAIVDTTVRLIRRSSLTPAADRTVVANLLQMITRDLQHAEDHMLLLGRKNALERVAAFLVDYPRS